MNSSAHADLSSLPLLNTHKHIRTDTLCFLSYSCQTLSFISRVKNAQTRTSNNLGSLIKLHIRRHTTVAPRFFDTECLHFRQDVSKAEPKREKSIEPGPVLLFIYSIRLYVSEGSWRVRLPLLLSIKADGESEQVWLSRFK